MLFSGNLSNDVFGGVISTYFVYTAVLHLLYLSFRWSCWAKMGCCNDRGTKKVENHWFSATVSNAERRQEQSFRTVHRTIPERKCSHSARKFACSWFHLFPLWCLFVCSLIRKSCVCTCWKKWRPFCIFFGHSPTMVDEKYFRWKWTYFKKIYKGRLNFFWSWRHFLDTSRLTKILEGTLPLHTF